MEAAEIWLVDDDRSLRRVLRAALSSEGFAVRVFADVASAMNALDLETPALLVTDVRLGEDDGLALLQRVKRREPSLPVVVMSAYTDLSTTVGAFGGGAFDYLPKPFDLDRLLDVVRRAVSLPVAAPAPETQGGLIGQTAAMREVFRAIGRLSRTELTVLVTGETGTGKELVARALHEHSPRAGKPFVALNTAAIAPELLESELFGHEQGAFTGALRRHVGRFEQAHGGTLFLDEIGDMPAGLQSRLLRVLAEGEFYRVGGRELIRADVRIVAATHRDLAALVASGAFRADLLHRLDVVRLQLPPLRERLPDLPELAAHFLAEAARELELPAKGFGDDGLHALAAHAWPGNVRELRNLCRRLLVLGSGPRIGRAEVLRELAAAATATTPTGDWRQALAAAVDAALADGEPGLLDRLQAECEQVAIARALHRSGGDRQRAARLLGCGRNTLTRKLGRKDRVDADPVRR